MQSPHALSSESALQRCLSSALPVRSRTIKKSAFNHLVPMSKIVSSHHCRNTLSPNQHRSTTMCFLRSHVTSAIIEAVSSRRDMKTSGKKTVQRRQVVAIFNHVYPKKWKHRIWEHHATRTKGTNFTTPLYQGCFNYSDTMLGIL